MKKRIAWATCGVMASGAWLFAALLWAANVSEVEVLSQHTQTYVTVYGLLGAWVVGAVLVTVLIAIGFANHWQQRSISVLYWPIVAFFGLMLFVLSILALSVLDFLVHGGRLVWHLTDEPEIRLANALIFLAGFVGGGGWLLGVVLAARGWRRGKDGEA